MHLIKADCQICALDNNSSSDNPDSSLGICLFNTFTSFSWPL